MIFDIITNPTFDPEQEKFTILNSFVPKVTENDVETKI